MPCEAQMQHQRCHTRVRRGATQDAAFDVAQRRTRRPTRLLARRFVSAFFFSSRIRADSARFAPMRLRFASNRADLAKIGPYRPYRVVSAGGRYGRNRLETAETCRKRLKSVLNMARKGETCILLSFFFVNQGIVMCFLRIF